MKKDKTLPSFDEQYINIANEILDHGAEITGRNGLRYKQMFGQTIKIDLREGFPALTLRRLPVKNLFHEFAWDVSGGSEIAGLGPAAHFWDFLADEQGRLPGSYGRSWRRWPVTTAEAGMEWEKFHTEPFDQLSWIREQLLFNCTNRQLVLTTLNPSYEGLTCPPCHPSVIFSSDGWYLDVLVTARSNDLACGIPLDVFRYAMLAEILASDTGLEARFLQITSANNHIYSSNEAAIREIISREPKDCAPKLRTNPYMTIFELDPLEDFELIGYDSHPALRMEVAK